MIKWFHIMDKQPNENDIVVQLNLMGKQLPILGMGKYSSGGISFEEYLNEMEKLSGSNPDFYWAHVSDFNFPCENNDGYR